MKILFLAFALTTGALAATSASACSFPPSSLEQQIVGADEIFIATLLEAKLMPISGRHQGPWIEGRFKIEKILKGGPQSQNVTLTTGLGRGDCGVAMMVSSKYIVFKGKNDMGIGDPGGTHLIEDFQADELTARIQSILRREHSARGAK